MRILVYGAGVLGSLYAAQLQRHGHDVTVLARGRRLDELRRDGIVLEDAHTDARTVTPVAVVAALAPDDAYDLALVPVRANQLAAILPTLAANRRIPTILIMTNLPVGPDALAAALGRGRVVLGYAGAGGHRSGGVVRYHVLAGWQQPTTLGELDGRTTPRLAQLTRLFADAGFPIATSAAMPAWLQTHLAWTLPTALALYAMGGDIARLARARDAVGLLIRAVRENFRVLRALGIPVTPASLRALDRLPEPLLATLLQRLLAVPMAAVVIAGHANAARDEFDYLAAEWSALARRAGIPIPVGERLAQFLDQGMPPLVAGGAAHPSHRRGLVLGLAALVGASTAIWAARRRMLRRTHRPPARARSTATAT